MVRSARKSARVGGVAIGIISSSDELLSRMGWIDRFGRLQSGAAKRGPSMTTKVYASAREALEGVVRDDITLMCGGFGLCGIPENLINALCESGVRGLTVVSN